MKKKLDKNEKQMNEVMAENRRLVEPLQKAREEVEDLKKKLANYDKDKQALVNSKARLRVSAPSDNVLVRECLSSRDHFTSYLRDFRCWRKR